MVQSRGRIRIDTLFNIVYGTAFVAAACLLVAFVSFFMRQQAIDEAGEKARILQDRNLATHSYYTEILKPRLFDWSAPFRSPDYFDPSWMSSSYAVRQIQRNFDKLDPTGYTIKDAAINARNPGNEADPTERAFIDETNANPSLITRSFMRTIDGVPTLIFLRRGEVLVESCLQCHSDPARAPSGLVALYGPDRAFHREGDLGKVISAISIRIPLATALAKVDRFTFNLSLVLVALLAFFFLLQRQLFKKLLYAPIAALRDKSLEISRDEKRLGEEVPLPFGRELGDLAGAYNKMSGRLKRDRDGLEDRIRERSAELLSANDRLELDIEARKATEERLQKALEENRNLLEELQHRAKNSLSMISGLISIVSSSHESGETRSVLDELDRRVRSIAELYSLLHASGMYTEVRLDDYCGRIATAMEGLARSVSLEVEAEAVTVPIAIAAPIGLIITELVTNALKYAFPEGVSGRILIAIAREGTKLRIAVADNGLGLTAGVSKASGDGGTGLELLEGLAKQIGGTLVVEDDKPGTRCTLTLDL
ncbi:MAG TPA: DUF3365 domain-containing protein [Rectinemataceae bacterium]|nr:DUF3365 domain-containing protein [Rectinemataceae bacterium]